MLLFPDYRKIVYICALLGFADFNLILASEDYRFANDWVKYESGTNTGLKPASILAGTNPFSFPRPRPKVSFDVPTFGGQAEGISGYPLREVEVSFREEAGVDRKAAVRFGFPLPKGAIFNPRSVEFRAPDNQPLPAQYNVISRWPDGSLKWLLITSRISVQKNEIAACRVALGKGILRQDSPSELSIREDPDSATITTGPLQAEIGKSRFSLIGSTTLDRNGDAHFEKSEAGIKNGDAGVSLIRPDGKVFSTSALAPGEWEIEERGPERIVVRVSGKYGNADGETWMRYVTRLTFSSGSPVVGISHTHINDDLTREFSDLKSLNMDFLTPQKIASVLTDFQEPDSTARRFLSAQSLAVFQADDRRSSWNVDGLSRDGGRTPGAWTVTERHAASGIAVQDFWQRWPKGFQAAGDRIRIGLLPEQPDATFGAKLPYHLMFPFVDGNFRFKWGMASTERLLVDFSGKIPRKELLAEAQLPLVAVVDAKWYSETGALGAIPAPDGAQFEIWDDFVKRSFEAHAQLSERQREYGFFNYGDWFGERKRNWGNNEYDRAHGFFQQFARTGDTGYFRLALQAARHQADVDIVHAYPNARYVGANHQHSIGHTGVWEGPNSPKQATWSHKYDSHTDGTNGHTWSDGLADAWCLTGDATVMEPALELGEHLTWAVAPSFKSLGTHERSAGWSLKALMGLYRARPDPAYLDAAAKIARVAVASQTKEQGGAWAHPLPPDHSPGQEVGNCPFLVGILLTGLAEYHSATSDPAAMAALESGCRWLRTAWNDQYGTWPYSADVNGKPLMSLYGAHLNPLIANALAYVGAATSNPEYMGIVNKAMARSFWFAGHEGVGKELAELMNFTPDTLFRLATYFRSSDPKNAASLLSWADPGLRDEILLSFPSGGEFWLRGPSQRSIFLSLGAETARGTAVRKLYGSAKTNLASGRFSLTPFGGTPVVVRDFQTTEKLTIPLELAGKAGDVFEAKIEDDISGAWKLSADGARLVAAAGQGLHFAGINQRQFWFFVRPGTEKFALSVQGIHHGAFGAAVISPSDKVAAFAANSNSSIDPALGAAQQKPEAKTLTVRPESQETGKLWRAAIWAAGDITCKLEGVPPYLAPDPDSWFNPEAHKPE